jgi:hypothetical protein
VSSKIDNGAIELLARHRKQSDLCVIALAFLSQASTAAQIGAFLTSHGVNTGGWNLSRNMAGLRPLAVKLRGGVWHLTEEGKAYANSLGFDMPSPIAREASLNMQSMIDELKDEHSRFCKEGLKCFDERLYRASVTFFFAGAIALLRQNIFDHDLRSFNKAGKALNAAGKSKFPAFKTVKTVNGYTEFSDRVFLDVARESQYLSKPRHDSLLEALTLRNKCAHPSDYNLSENKAAATISDLIANAYSPISKAT